MSTTSELHKTSGFEEGLGEVEIGRGAAVKRDTIPASTSIRTTFAAARNSLVGRETDGLKKLKAAIARVDSTLSENLLAKLQDVVNFEDLW